MKLAVDTSALIAVIRSEPEASHILDVLANAEQRFVSAATLLEAAIVTSGKGDEAERLDILVERIALEVVPLSANEASVGAEAFRKFGKGSGHPAKLNFGDCFSYALAKTRGLPLLFKGDDFVHTDIQAAAKPV